MYKLTFSHSIDEVVRGPEGIFTHCSKRMSQAATRLSSKTEAQVSDKTFSVSYF